MLPDDAPVSYRIVGKPVEAMLTGMRRLSPIDLRNASALGGCIYTKIVLLSQIINEFFTTPITSASGAKCSPKVSLLPPSRPATASLLPECCFGYLTG